MSDPKMRDPVKCPNRMCPIPAGKFKMGSTNGDPDEKPVREVELSAYAMKRHPVTISEYKAYLEQRGGARYRFEAVIRGCGDKSRLEVLGKGKDPFELEKLLPKVDGKKVCEARIKAIPAAMPKMWRGYAGDDQPMIGVNWYEAQAYCEFYGMTLPTEAQWERGARGLAGNKKYGTLSGDISINEAPCDDFAMTVPVCSKPANDLGLCDMAGNVWEWTADWYWMDAYESMAPKDPRGPITSRCMHLGFPFEYLKGFKVIRGASWRTRYLERGFRAANRAYEQIDNWNDTIGFRCVSAPKESKK